MTDIGAMPPHSMRDAFYKILDNPALKDRAIILAEDATRDTEFAYLYKDFLSFEGDLAQITELILLFCESEGSLAELGAFSLIEEAARRLLVVIRDIYYNKNSFIKHGPIKFLEQKYGHNLVYVIDDLDINIVGGSAHKIRIDVLRDRLQSPIKDRLDADREKSTFDSTRHGHLIKLIVGLVQDYGALTKQEIVAILKASSISVPEEQVSAFLYCAKAVEWLEARRKGLDEFFIAKNVGDAAELRIRGTTIEKNKGRRRFLVREHWRKVDPLRHKSIQEVYGVAT